MYAIPDGRVICVFFFVDGGIVSGLFPRRRIRAMNDVVDDDLRRRTWRLLQPGDIELDGVIVHTDLPGSEDIEMHEASVEVGDVIAEHAAVGDHYVYSGVDDPEFASNQHQGRTVEDDAFVWECQQLLRDGTFDLVFYYESTGDQEPLLSSLRAAGYDVTGVEGDREEGYWLEES
jgi:hypothetical protein